MTDIQQDNTTKKPGKPFTKGDPRINRKGRPKDFDALRKLFQEVGNEIATGPDGQPVINPATGKPYTRIELAVRAALSNPRQLKTVLAYGYGVPPQAVELTGSEGGPIKTYIAISPDDWDKAADGE